MRNQIDLRAVRGLARAFRQSDTQLVHVHTGRANWLGGLAARAVGLPTVSSRRMDRRVKRGWRTRLLYRHLVQRVVAISPAVAACLRDGGVPDDRIELIAEGIEPSRLVPARDRTTTRAALGAGAEQVVLLAVAALVARKGLDVLLDALAQLATDGLRPPLWVAGAGPERAALEARCKRAGLSTAVRFLGARDDTADLLAACDIFVLPARREGLGVSALEAMAAARPVIASAVGGLTFSVVDGRTGLLVAPDDAAALAAAIRRVIGDPALRTRLGQAGPARVREGFLAEQMVAAHERLYQTVAEAWRQRRH
jgi:glycosyltransferase involved in cell wall biosynthesis